jgi:hypothetical protein
MIIKSFENIKDTDNVQDHFFESFVNLAWFVQKLCFWTLSIILSLSANTVLFIFQNTTFRIRILSPSSGKTYSAGPNR